MSVLLADRAILDSPLDLVTSQEGRMLGLRLPASSHARIRPGVYARRAGIEALRSWERYALRVHAFRRQHPSAILALESAAVLHGLPLFGEPRDIQVYDPERPSSRRYGDVAVHTSRDALDVAEVSGALLTSLEETVIGLARVLPPAQALAVVDASISHADPNALDLRMLRERAAAQQNRRGNARLRWLWERADGASESPSESVSRAVIEWTGFETPVLQREYFYEGFHDRVDFSFPSCRAIGEADGWQKYVLADPAEAARRLAKEKHREDRLRRNGHPFARWELADAWRVEPLVRALRGAGLRPVRPRQAAFLASLARRPREKPHFA
ncbi:hypothetical protein JOD62_001158 [Microbacterium keratanolyticum]|uniref:CTP synthase n=1 Tax=Microbacterium keratanolyticum TaxID=67574 RepID=A0A9W6HPU0_9MICO|nr:hypothetical protein [Microbacterium keratanolyticum]MBM7468610.1 hypothetical protein [Microbacterium keratanolyticum]GLK00686.1 CTP synthase [Microbacterium keratanolyticum]